MLKSLFASCLLSLGVSTPSLPVSLVKEPSRAITQEVHGDYEVTYKYESNEVSTVDDLVRGNIYEFDFSTYDIDDLSSSFAMFSFVPLINFSYYTAAFSENYVVIDYNVDSYTEVLYSFSSSSFLLTLYNGYVSGIDDYTYVEFNGNIISSVVGVLNDFNFDPLNDVNHLSSIVKHTDYNVIESVTRIERHSNLYTLIYDFYYYLFENHTLSGITTAYNMPFDSWIAHTMTIVTLLTLIVIIFFFLRWLFRVVSGLILLKH